MNTLEAHYTRHRVYDSTNLARPTGIEPVTYGLAYHHGFHRPPERCTGVRGLDYIFAIAGGTRIVSTDPNRSILKDGLSVSSVLPSPLRVKGLPIQCPPL